MNLLAERNHHRKNLNRAANEKDPRRKENLYRRYLRKVPADPQVNFNVGQLIQARAKTPGERFEAAEFYERVMSSPIVDPELKASALNNLGIMMAQVNEPARAKTLFFVATQVCPAHVEARINYAESLRFDCSFEEADREFAELLNLAPDHPSVHFNAGMLALMMGDFERGWREYEWRFGVPSFGTPALQSDRPRWKGEDLDGKTLLLWGEQGFGDSIQFIRYAREIKDRWPGAQVWYYGHTALVTLLSGADGLNLACDIREHEDFDFQLPIMSAPHVMGTRLDTVPARTPYIRKHDSWKPVDMPPSDKIKVGIVWAGSPRHGKDKWRSLEPEQFQPIIDAHPECQFYSLQCGPRAGECVRIVDVIDLASRITTWDQTAQVLMHLDLLISVDTACVHLAGAVDCPAWMLTPHSPDFRWMLAREDSPWYPRLRLFRQPARDAWEPVIDRICREPVRKKAVDA